MPRSRPLFGVLSAMLTMSMPAAAFILLVALAFGFFVGWWRLRLTTAALNAEKRRLEATLGIVFDPYVITETLRDGEGRVVDFLYKDANPAACAWIGVDRDRLLGRRMLDVDPAVATTGLFGILVDAAERGIPVSADAFPIPRGTDGMHWLDIRAERVEGGLGIAWRDVTERRAAEAILERRASTDELTNLLNRKEALEQVEALNRRGGRGLAALWCDIDRFKLVNDTYGHATGDAVLQALADRIRGCLRSTDDIGARIGGDELLILLHGVRGIEEAMNVAEMLRRRAAEPIPTAAGPIAITLSIGVTIANPNESTDALLARADDAMYQAKNRGRNQVVAIAATDVLPVS